MGGADADIYQFAGAFGSDVIDDSGGSGTIQLAGTPLTGNGAKQTSATSNTWKSDDGQVTYSVVQVSAARQDLVVTVAPALTRAPSPFRGGVTATSASRSAATWPRR